MNCSHCEQAVEQALEDLPGIRGAEASRKAEQVTFEGDADLEEVVAAIEAEGYST